MALVPEADSTHALADGPADASGAVPGAQSAGTPSDTSGSAPAIVAIDAGAGAGAAIAQPQPIIAPMRVTGLRFHGRGSEYFRIWIVNTLLTLLTLGLYSAWAKVRKTRYFWQNTSLDGFAFDFHARPWPILRGRILAFALLLSYSWAMDFSRTAGLSMIVLMCVIGPWLFMKSQQFKFVNSSWRGLRFGFEHDLPRAYRQLLPLLLLWFATSIAGLAFSAEPGAIAVAGLAMLVMWPWMHHRLKAYQHAGAQWGELHAQFKSCVGGFYGTYLLGGLLIVAAMLPIGILVGLASVVGNLKRFGNVVEVVTGLLLVVLVYVLTQPYVATRLQKRVWAATRIGPVRFHTDIKALRLMKLVLVNGALTLLTLGLYWPFASVAIARYRIECMQVHAPTALDEISAGVRARRVDATGDGAADAFGLDIGL